MVKKLCLAVSLVICLVGCVCPEQNLLIEHRKQMIEAVQWDFASALQNAKDEEGKPLLIVELRDAQLGLVLSMIESIDKVLPPTDEEKAARKPFVAPWAEELAAKKAAGEKAKAEPAAKTETPAGGTQ